MSNNPEKITLSFEFDNQEAVQHFATWLCESGEQSYWDWMQDREQDEGGAITVVNFHYHPEDEKFPKNSPKRYGKFLDGNVIRATCGRMDETV